MTMPDKSETAFVTNRSVDDRSNGPWDNSALAKFREWEPLWVDQCLKMSADPWTNGVLPRKDVELISIAVNAACTNLSAEGTRRHIRGALEAGASRDEILMVIKIGSLLSIHTASLGAPILLEEAKAAGVKPEEIMEVLEICVAQGVQASNLGVPILAEELERAQRTTEGKK